MKCNDYAMQIDNALVVQSLTATAHVQWASSFPFLFSLHPLSSPSDFLGQFSKRALLGKSEGLPPLLCMDSLSLDDLALVRDKSSALFIRNNQETLLNEKGSIHNLITHAEKLGFRIFQDPEANPVGVDGVQSIEFIEFVVSEDERLRRFPRESVSSGALQTIASTKAIFVLNLIQDFEILGSFIKQFSSLCRPGNCTVIVTTRVQKCHLWGSITAFLSALSVQVVIASKVFEAAAWLPQHSGVLFTASESSASGHDFCYHLCRLASPALLKVTFQHGYENVGLRHHISHNASYKKGIRFASDVIFTWVDKEKLVDAYPSELARCIPVGTTKKVASDALMVRNKRFNSLAMTADSSSTESSQPITILLCENLHSVRFNDVALREAFLSVMHQLHNSPRVRLKIRSHPGKRLLEQDEAFKKFEFLTGELTGEALANFDLLISPPSTIILDAVLCGIHTLVWSASRQLGDLRYYSDLGSIDKSSDFIDVMLMSNQGHIDVALKNLAWAAKNTTAFDGGRFVLSHVGELL
jgi:hypothetical protein